MGIALASVTEVRIQVHWASIMYNEVKNGIGAHVEYMGKPAGTNITGRPPRPDRLAVGRNVNGRRKKTKTCLIADTHLDELV